MSAPAPPAKPKRKREAPPAPERAFGRSLDDFGELSPAERTLLDCCRRGESAVIGKEVPIQETDSNRIRANFIRFLALGGDDRAPVHEHGVTVAGAWLTGTLDLSVASVPRRLSLWSCRIEQVEARQAKLIKLHLEGSRVEQGIAAAEMRCEGGVFLRNGFRATGAVQFIGARIEGNLECSEGRFEHENGKALNCCGVRVGGAFDFRDVEVSQGDVDLSGLQADVLLDDLQSWSRGNGKLILDGFVYNRISGRSPVDARSRVAWLELQWAEHLGSEFKPQPWEQLIHVLKKMGHPEEARAIAIAKQIRLREAGKIVRGARALHYLYGLLVGYGYRPMRLLVATASVWLLCFLAYWAATNPAWFGAQTHLLAPPPATSGKPAPAPDYRNFVPLIYSADVLLPVVDLGYKDEWQPVVADRAGNPSIWGQLLRFLYWFEIAFGWVAGLLLVGVLGNLIKKD